MQTSLTRAFEYVAALTAAITRTKKPVPCMRLTGAMAAKKASKVRFPSCIF